MMVAAVQLAEAAQRGEIYWTDEYRSHQSSKAEAKEVQLETWFAPSQKQKNSRCGAAVWWGYSPASLPRATLYEWHAQLAPRKRRL
jgi:hypothetical protein